MKRRELERHLRAHGWQLVDEGSNHTRWAGPARERSVVRATEIDPSRPQDAERDELVAQRLRAPVAGERVAGLP